MKKSTKIFYSVWLALFLGNIKWFFLGLIFFPSAEETDSQEYCAEAEMRKKEMEWEK
jgi:hypothetical protein